MESILTTTLDPVVPNMKEWPIYEISQNKEEFLNSVIDQTESKIIGKLSNEKDLHDLLGKVLYAERSRLTQKPWKADPDDEKDFWNNIRESLLRIEHNGNSDNIHKSSEQYVLFRKILERYAKEISGNFSPQVYKFARTTIPLFISKVLNAAPSNRYRFWSSQKTLDERIQISGEIDKIRRLGKNNTIVAVPTHFSNLDSVIIGYALERIGLPAFTYGAGLNLFSIGILNYFMGNLGAYKVDRRKKNMIYLELLKNYSTVSLFKGANGLFFPGGTRSRSGSLETSLKLGFLGTTIEAQRLLIEQTLGKDYRKVYILPCIFNYPFVLEANGLIEEYLKSTGKDKYLKENDEYSTSGRILHFIFKFLFANSHMHISYGPLMDVLGNLVDEEGRSIDKHGRTIELKDYFTINGDFTLDIQRENEYTRMLEKAIVDKYYTHNTVLSSHLLSFTGFVTMKKQYPELDLYAFLRLPNEDTEINYEHFARNVNAVRQAIFELEKKGKVRISSELNLPIDELIKHGLENMGIYHAQKVLKLTENNKVLTQDKKLLFYYHNRTTGYGLEEFIL